MGQAPGGGAGVLVDGAEGVAPHRASSEPFAPPSSLRPLAPHVILVVLSGDVERACGAVAARFPSAEIEAIDKERLRTASHVDLLRRLRRRRPHDFVFYTHANAWQLGRFKMLVYAWLAGARRTILLDLEGEVEEFGAARIWLREAPRAVAEYLLGLPLIVLSMLVTWVLAGLVGRGRRRFPGARGSSGGPLDILFLRPTPGTGVVEGGESAHIRGVLGGLVALGHRPRVLSNSRLPAVTRAGHDVDVRPPSALFSSHRLAFELWNNLVFTAQTWREVRRRRPDVIYQRYSRNNWTGTVVAGLTGLPLLLEWNGSEVWVGRHWSHLRWTWVISAFERANYRGADAIVVVSRALARALEAEGVDPSRITINPNGADPDRFRPGAGGGPIRARHGLGNRVVVGFVGAFNYYQGAPLLMHAAASVCGRCDAHFLIVGSGDTLAAARSAAREGGISDRATFTGHVPIEEVPAHIDACDIAVAPMVPNVDGSEFFNSPVKLFEYMAAGRAIVASRLGQIEEIVEEGETGLLVEPGSVLALADAIVELALDPALRERLGGNARRVAVEHYTWRANAARALETYDRVIGGR